MKPENVLVFGDGLNDLELFDYAGISIAMGISAPELQEKADYITKNLEEDGIFYALEELNMVEKELTLPQLELGVVEGPIAVIKTNHGEMKIQLFPDQAPKQFQTLWLLLSLAIMMVLFSIGLLKIS